MAYQASLRVLNPMELVVEGEAMIREQPLEDAFIVHCKGFCDPFIVIAVSQLPKAVKHAGGFRALRTFTCARCKKKFEKLVAPAANTITDLP
jgi:hypothetical protein